MSDLKNLKSIDISSITIIGTGIQILFAIILSIILLIAVGIVSSSSIGGIIYLVPTLIFGTLIFAVFRIFTESYLYNILVSKLNSIKFIIKDEKEITGISVLPTSILSAVIGTIFFLIVYLTSIFIVPLMLSSMIQTFMLSGQIQLAFMLYQIYRIISSPVIIIISIIGVFVITFLFTAIATYLYNLIANKTGGIIVELSKENGMTVLESIDPKAIAIIFAIISLVLNLIVGIVMAISTGVYSSIISSVVGGFITTFISSALVAIFYNFLAPKLGKLKVELVDE